MQVTTLSHIGLNVILFHVYLKIKIRSTFHWNIDFEKWRSSVILGFIFWNFSHSVVNILDFASSHNISRTSYYPIPKDDVFNMASVRHVESRNMNFCQFIYTQSHFQIPEFVIIRLCYSLRYMHADRAIFISVAVRHFELLWRHITASGNRLSWSQHCVKFSFWLIW